MPDFATKDGIRVTPLDYEGFESHLELVCRTCNKKGTYSVGRIFINPHTMRRVFQKEVPYEEAVFFSGCFRCKKCGLGGPWKIPEFTQTRLAMLQMMAAEKKPVLAIHFGELRLFDGTPVHSGGEGEAYLRRLIEAEPQNFFLWSRLGNLFNIAEEPDRAFPCFEKAIELNPHDVESHHSLGDIYRARGELDQAAKHYYQVLLHAREAPPQTREKAELLKRVVRSTLECLLELRDETDGRIDLLPTPCSHLAKSELPKEAVLVLKSYDLSQESDWERLTNSVFGDVAPDFPPPLAPRRQRSFSGYRLEEEPTEQGHVGRNDPCPCGSGKKFKKCCKQ